MRVVRQAISFEFAFLMIGIGKFSFMALLERTSKLGG
jgi:hypothetical protein